MSQPLRTLLWTSLGLLLTASGCAPKRVPVEANLPETLPTLTEVEVVHLFPPSVRGASGWAGDVLAALDALGLPASAPNVCAVLAIVQQESGFQANPVVPELALIVRRRLESYEARLGPFGKPALHALLEGHAPGVPGTFEERLAKVRTEYDVDRIFRDLLANYHDKHPLAYGAAELADSLFTSGHLEDLNPVTTAGSMQVSVRFAEELARTQKGPPPEAVRDALYTRRGGVHYGTARLLGYAAGYERELYRFADYNAGVFASRNAALQHQLSTLTGIRLTADGDLLAYDRQAHPVAKDSESLRALLAFRAEYAPELSERQLRADVLHEKDASFEATQTYRAVRRAFARAQGTAAPYAAMPEVVISSPKMKHERSTAWYADAVERRFEACLARAPRSPQAASVDALPRPAQR